MVTLINKTLNKYLKIRIYSLENKIFRSYY